MSDADLLETASGHIEDAVDALDEMEEDTKATVLAAAVLTLARLFVQAALTKYENGGA